MAENCREIFDRVIRPGRQERVRCGAVLPHAELDRQPGIVLKRRLRQQRGQVARQQIPAAALRQAWIP